MSYYPYLRGNLSDLLTLRDTAKLMARHNFTPIIEAKLDQLYSVRDTIDRLNREKVKPIVILNPYSEHSRHSEISAHNHWQHLGKSNKYTLGLQLHSDMCSELAIEICRRNRDRKIALIHTGFRASNGFAYEIKSIPNVKTNVFIESDCGKLYMEKFNFLQENILIRDGLKFRSEYSNCPNSEFFSDLHITYNQEKVIGFGDFLSVGRVSEKYKYPEKTYSINLTYLEPKHDNAMFVYHFLSDKNVTPKSRGSLFLSALSKLINAVDSKDSNIFKTKAIEQFQELNATKYYPGVSFVRQLLLTHHIETLSHYKNKKGEF